MRNLLLYGSLCGYVKVLITLPRLDAVGGVVNYYRVLRRHLEQDIRYFEVGALFGNESRFAAFWRFILDFWRFHRELRVVDYDLVHVNPSMKIKAGIREGIFILIAKWHRKKVIVFFRGWDSECEDLVRRRMLWLFRKSYGRADAFIVLGTEFEQKLVDLGIRVPIFIETTIVDDRIIEEFDRSELPEKSESDALDILFLSRLARNKGLLESISAFEKLKSPTRSVSLTIAGDGSERAAAERLVAELGLDGVNFVGNVADEAKRKVYAEADIFLYPTFFGEGMPNVVLEAMAYGLPVVTRPVGGVKDFFENGRMGFLTESGDPAEIADLLTRLMADSRLRREMGQYNRHYAEERFKASRVAARLLGIYDEVSYSG